MEFVAAVSHELRTPVSVIGAAAGNLADGVVGDPQRVRKYGETIQGEARRLAETVERVLQLAGIAAGRGRRGADAGAVRRTWCTNRSPPAGPRSRPPASTSRSRSPTTCRTCVGDVTGAASRRCRT